MINIKITMISRSIFVITNIEYIFKNKPFIDQNLLRFNYIRVTYDGSLGLMINRIPMNNRFYFGSLLCMLTGSVMYMNIKQKNLYLHTLLM